MSINNKVVTQEMTNKMKKMLSLILILGIPTAIGSSVISIPKPAVAADAVTLGSGNSTTFPTWALGRKTRLCAQATEGSTEVRVNAGSEEESFKVGRNAKCIDRSWGGIRIGVTNRGTKNVKVWTS